jgi:hypothetical protein
MQRQQIILRYKKAQTGQISRQLPWFWGQIQNNLPVIVMLALINMSGKMQSTLITG